MGTGFKGDYKSTSGALKPEHLMDELRNSGHKFNEKDVVMVTKTKKNELVWLEKGSKATGLAHIIERHEKDLEKKFGVKKESIPAFVKEIFQNGVEISNKFKNNGFEKKYKYKDQYIVITGVGTNGYIISLYPDPKGGK